MSAKPSPSVPPRSHSLKINDSAAPAPLAVAFDYDDNDEDGENEELRISAELVAKAKEALAMVDDGWSKDELRPVVPKLIDRIETLTDMLVKLQAAQSELQTSLLVTQSNLTLALANTEMLEEALQRADSSKGKDIGWKRWSDREGLKRTQTTGSSNLSQEPSTPRTAALSEDGSDTSKRHTHHGAGGGTQTPTTPASSIGRTSLDAAGMRMPPMRSQSDITTTPFRHPSASTPSLVPASTAPPSRSTTPTPAPAAAESGFFSKLRFGKMNASSTALDSSPSTKPVPLAAAHDVWTTGGEPVEDSKDVLLKAERKKNELLASQLEAEKKAKTEAIDEKSRIELELETLSEALFEEANKMVKTERIKRAEAEDELRIAHAEKEALRSALRIVESENNAARSSSAAPSASTSRATTLDPPNVERKASSSSISGKAAMSITIPKIESENLILVPNKSDLSISIPAIGIEHIVAVPGKPPISIPIPDAHPYNPILVPADGDEETVPSPELAASPASLHSEPIPEPADSLPIPSIPAKKSGLSITAPRVDSEGRIPGGMAPDSDVESRRLPKLTAPSVSVQPDAAIEATSTDPTASLPTTNAQPAPSQSEPSSSGSSSVAFPSASLRTAIIPPSPTPLTTARRPSSPSPASAAPSSASAYPDTPLATKSTPPAARTPPTNELKASLTPSPSSSPSGIPRVRTASASSSYFLQRDRETNNTSASPGATPRTPSPGAGAGTPRSPSGVSSRIAAARQAFEGSSPKGGANGNAKGPAGTVRKLSGRRSPPPPVKIPGFVPRLPVPKPTTPGADDDEV